MKKVVCLKWGNKYSSKYANILYSMVRRHTSGPLEFVCVTEDGKNLNRNIVIKEMPTDFLSGWWNKLSLFKPGILEGRFLFLDLDIVIHGSIDPLFELMPESPFCVIRDFGRYYKNTYNSSVMRFDSQKTNYIWEEYMYSKKEFDNYDGDQNVISKILKEKHNHEIFPDHLTWSYKFGSIRNKYEKLKLPPPKSIMSIFHGHPNPPEVKDKWVVDNWRQDIPLL